MLLKYLIKTPGANKMPNLSTINQQSIRALTEAVHSLPWYTRWLFPTQLKMALAAHQTTTNETKTAWLICNVYLNNTWFFQRWGFSCLRRFSESPLIKACSNYEFVVGLSYKETEEKHDNFDALATSERPSSVARKLFAANAYGVFDGEDGQANRDAIANSAHPSSVSRTLALLRQNTTLLTHANREAIAKHPDKNLDTAVSVLLSAHLLHGPEAQANLDTLLTATKPYGLASLLVAIHQKGLLSQANRDALARHQDEEDDLNSALSFFNDTRPILTRDGAQANLDAILQAPHNRHNVVTRALLQLERAGLLTGDAAQANRDALVKHPEAGVAIYTLNDAELGSQANFNAVTQHQPVDPEAIARSLVKLNRAGLLTGDDEGQAIRDIVAGDQAPEDVATAIICLNRSQGNDGFIPYAQRKIAQTFFQPEVAVPTTKSASLETVNVSP